MAVIVTKRNHDTELQKRIQADMDKKVAAGDHDKTPDLVDDSEYVKDTKKTSKFGWVWLVLIVLAILSLISIFAF